jgi:uncharacterized protein YrzB (UPF0473 family)
MTEKNVENENMEPKIIKTQDENGELHNFELLNIVKVDGQDYGLLVYVDEEEKEDDDDEEEEVVIMRLSQENGTYVLETVEDDNEFDKVLEYLETEMGFEAEEDDE